MHEVEVAEPPPALLEVEPVAGEELVRDGEADVTDRQVVDESAVRPVEQRADGDVRRPAESQYLDQVVEREPGVDDVRDEKDVPSDDGSVDVLDDADARAAAERPAIARERNEVYGVGQADLPGEIRDEDEGALEDRDEQQVAILVVPGDVGAQLGDAGPNLLLGEVDAADRAVRYEASFRPYL